MKLVPFYWGLIMVEMGMVDMFMHITELPLTENFPTRPMLPRPLPRVISAKHISIIRLLTTTTLAGSLRREQMAEASIKKLKAEIEQLN